MADELTNMWTSIAEDLPRNARPVALQIACDASSGDIQVEVTFDDDSSRTAGGTCDLARLEDDLLDGTGGATMENLMTHVLASARDPRLRDVLRLEPSWVTLHDGIR